MARVFLPQSLTMLIPGAPRQVELEAANVLELIDQLNARFPGMRSRLVTAGPVLREHILIFVNAEQADLSSAIPPGADVRVVPAITGG